MVRVCHVDSIGRIFGPGKKSMSPEKKKQKKSICRQCGTAASVQNVQNNRNNDKNNKRKRQEVARLKLLGVIERENLAAFEEFII